MQGEVVLERNNKTYRPGVTSPQEIIVGQVRLTNVPSGLQHNGVLVIIEGAIKGRKSSKTPESEAIVAQAPPQIICNFKETVLQPGKL